MPELKPTVPAESPREGAEVDLEIADLAFGGQGVARRSGLVIFVQGALPGERVRARLLRVRRNYAEAAVLDVLSPSRDRVVPPCRHYADCGGCELQHLHPAAQARAKGSQVKEILTRIGGLGDPPVRETVMAGDAWAYRFRMDFEWTLQDRDRPRLGLHRRNRPAEIVPIDRCHLASETVNRIAGWIAEKARELRLSPWDPRRRRGLLRRTSIQEARGTGEVLVSFVTGRGDPPALGDLGRELMRRFPRVQGVVRDEVDRQGRRAGESVLAGRDFIEEEVDGDRFRVPSSAFFQPNATASAALRRQVLGALEPRDTERIVELFCGVGFFSLAAARRSGSVVGVEGSREACAAARVNAAKARLSNCQFIHGEVLDVLPDLLRGATAPDAILLDPPRTGLPAGAARLIADSDVSRVIYVSCDPATLARDMRTLVSGGRYRLVEVVPIDLFPQTHHIECVARLGR